MGFVEQQDEVEKTWKVLASFHYIEELIDCISITDDTDNTDDAEHTGEKIKKRIRKGGTAMRYLNKSYF